MHIVQKNIYIYLYIHCFVQILLWLIENKCPCLSMLMILWLFFFFSSFFTQRIAMMFNSHSAHLQKLVFQRLSQMLLECFHQYLVSWNICTKFGKKKNNSLREPWTQFCRLLYRGWLEHSSWSKGINYSFSCQDRQRTNKHCESYSTVIRTKKNSLWFL